MHVCAVHIQLNHVEIFCEVTFAHINTEVVGKLATHLPQVVTQFAS